MAKRSRFYTLLYCGDLEGIVPDGVRRLRLQFRGPKCPSGQRVLVNGTLTELLPFVRERWGQDGVTEVVDQAVALQRGRNDGTAPIA